MVAISTLAFGIGALAVLGVVAYDGDPAPAAAPAGGAAAPDCSDADGMACEVAGAVRVAERLAAGTLHAAADGAVVAAGLADEAVDAAADIGRSAVEDVRESQTGLHSPIGQFSRLHVPGP